MNKPTFTWNPGEKAALARAAKLQQRELSDFLAGRKKRFSVERAQRLEAASLLVLGANRMIPAAAWLRMERHNAVKEASHESDKNLV